MVADLDGGHAVAAVRRVDSWRRFPSWRRAGIALLLTLGVAGCGSAGQFPLLGDAAGASVALESIDGPPSLISQKFVRDLNEEASTRQIAVAPRGSAAPYRLRGYLAAYAENGTTAITWAWDVYDSADHRAFRFQGQEQAGAGGNAWTAADDEVLHRIARSSMEQLAVFLAAAHTPMPTATGVSAALPEPSLSVFATSFDDFRPEAAGIFRLLASDTGPTGDGAAATGGDAEDIPLPRLRPAPPAAAAALAFASLGR